jgi:hypothetical protein
MKVPDRDVMRLFDGELDARGRRRVAEERLRDPSVDARLAALRQVAAFTRVWARERRVRSATHGVRRWERTLGVRLALGGAVLSLAALVFLPRLGSDTGGPAARPPSEGAWAPAVAVEQVDFGAHPGTIFSVSAAGTETTVVWLSDDADESSLAL